MLKRISQSVLHNKLYFQRFQSCSSNANSQPSINTSSSTPEQFNTYKNINQIVKNEQLNPEKETNWNRYNDKEILQERKKVRDKRRENVMAISVAITYFLFEDQFEMDGLKIKKPEFNFFKSQSSETEITQNQHATAATANATA